MTDALMNYLNGDHEAWRTSIALRYCTPVEEIKKTWEKHKQAILSRWIEQHPGTRPCCWWRFDAPREYEICKGVSFAMRKQLSGPPHNFLGIPDVQSAVLPVLVCGLPVHHLEGRTFETEAEFLSRHKLLTADELVRLTPIRYKPPIETRRRKGTK